MENVAVITVPQSEWNELKAQINSIVDKVSALTSKEQKELLTPGEVMKLLKIGRTTYDKYVRESVLPVVKINKMKRAKSYVKRSELDRLISEGVV